MISFFFSSRRRHTRSLRDWSSDVCSSDLAEEYQGIAFPTRRLYASASPMGPWVTMTRSEERRVGKGVDLGGRRIIKKKKKKKKCNRGECRIVKVGRVEIEKK